MSNANAPDQTLLDAIRARVRGNELHDALALVREGLAAAPESGELHLLHGRCLSLLGDEFAAEAAYEQAVACDGGLTEAYERWGRLCLEREATDLAKDIFARWLAAQPDNPAPSYWLAALGAAPAPSRAAPAYVRDLYEGFAADFDEVMDRVGYAGPMYLGGVLYRELGEPTGELRILDAGCGTGLAAGELKPYACHLTGCDLSPAMLAGASATASYDSLAEADFCTPAAEWLGQFDAVICLEALIYFGALETPLGALTGYLKPGGLLVVTTEQLVGDAGSSVSLRPSGRYAHHDDHLEAAMIAAGLSEVQLTPAELRSEGGEPVAGWFASGRRVP